MKTKYYVTTWDADLQKFTPQKGVRTGPYSKWGLRRAMRKLRTMGYDVNRGDNFTAITDYPMSETRGDQP